MSSENFSNNDSNDGLKVGNKTSNCTVNKLSYLDFNPLRYYGHSLPTKNWKSETLTKYINWFDKYSYSYMTSSTIHKSVFDSGINILGEINDISDYEKYLYNIKNIK